MRELIKSYSDLSSHRAVGEIIKKHSQNKEDIRDLAKREINWDKVHTIMDLGCGYGWFEEALEGRFDLVLGIDCLKENKPGFLRAAKRIAKQAVFKKAHLPAPTEVPLACFDLVITTYSLYFFPEAIPEVKRLLCPDGIFLVITHSESMLEEGVELFDLSNLREVIRNFSAENGEGALKKHFSEVRFVDYPNALLFTDTDEEGLARYIDFKRGFLPEDVNAEAAKERVLDELKRRGSMKFNKNDRIFIAKK